MANKRLSNIKITITNDTANGGSNFSTKEKQKKEFVTEESNEKLPFIVSTMKNFASKMTFAYGAMKIADLTYKAVDYLTPYFATETGDYSFNIAYDNFFATLNMVFNPVDTILSFVEIEQRNRLENQRRTQQRILYGDTFVNAIGGVTI